MTEMIDFGGRTIEISRRAYKGRLKIYVYPNGRIKVSTDRSQSHRKIIKFLEKNQKWLENSLEKLKNLQKKHPSKKFVSGEIYPLLGKDYKLKLKQGFFSGLVLEGREIHWHLPYKEMELDEKLRQQYFWSFKEDYGQVAKKIMAERVHIYSKRMGLYPEKVQLGNQKTIWGSCSHKNRISLNFKLIIAPLEVIDYVVIHELAHIKYKNHSRDFWDLVEFYTPHTNFSKKWLSKNRYKSDFLSRNSELY